MVYSLQTGIVYGPVRSRRFGRSLGINLSPCARKLCSFDCVYCHYGATERLTTDLSKLADELPSAELVLDVVEGALRSPQQFEVVTFSGNGEPTLHPEFPAIARGVAELVERWQPEARTVLLSNSSGLSRREVHDALAVVDLPVLKLDAGTRETFQAVNRPARGIRFEEIVDELSTLSRITLQTLLIDGEHGNTSPHELSAYFELVRWIAPVGVQLYSTDRPVAKTVTRRVAVERLCEIAAQGQQRAGVPFRVHGV